jgi:large conductance mechanosensitive channel
MLEELKRIRGALEKKPAPPQPPPKGLVDEFVQFLNKYGVIGLAIAFIMGSAVNKLVSALVNYIVMPVITFFIPGGGWREALLYLGPIEVQVGQFAGAMLDFLIISLVVFFIMKHFQKANLK